MTFGGWHNGCSVTTVQLGAVLFVGADSRVYAASAIIVTCNIAYEVVLW